MATNWFTGFVDLKDDAGEFADWIGYGDRTAWCELAGVKWQDFDFADLDIDVQRSVVDQVVGRCETEASQERIPLDEYTAQDLLAWFQQTLYRDPDDDVFASNSSRCWIQNGKRARPSSPDI